MRRASEIHPQLPDWVWPERIPLRAITLIVGEGGVGKSTLGVELAARLTRGELTGQPEAALLALQEDDAAAVTIPRLIAADADLDRIDIDGEPGWRFPRDLERLDAYAAETRPALVIIDPLDASVPGLASQTARKILDDLAVIASRRGFALVALHHLVKSGGTVQQRIGGGRAVRAVARSILVLERLDKIACVLLDLPTDSDLLSLSHHKSNYGREAEALLFERITGPHPADVSHSVSRLVEKGQLGDVCDEILSPDSRGRGRGSERRLARVAIERFLLRGPTTAEDLQSDVTAIDVSQRTFERARADMAAEGLIESFQQEGRHWWRLCVPDRLPEGL